MGLGIAEILGLFIYGVLLYLIFRNFFVGNKQIAYALLAVLLVFGAVALNALVSDRYSDPFLAIGLSPLLYFFTLTELGIPLSISVAVATGTLCIPFAVLRFVSKKSSIEASVSNPRRVHVLQLFELVLGGTFAVLVAVIVWYIWLSPWIEEQFKGRAVSVLQSSEADTTSCTQESLYGFTYYVAPNKETACYGKQVLEDSVINVFVPLESVSLEIAQKLNGGIQSGTTHAFAFDSNYFYRDGKALYSRAQNSFELIRVPKIGEEGSIRVQGTTYRVVMTGTIGATLK